MAAAAAIMCQGGRRDGDRVQRVPDEYNPLADLPEQLVLWCARYQVI